MESFYNSIKIYELQKQMNDTTQTQDIEELVEEKERKPRKLRQNEIFAISKRNEKSSTRTNKTSSKNKSY